MLAASRISVNGDLLLALWGVDSSWLGSASGSAVMFSSADDSSEDSEGVLLGIVITFFLLGF